ncbi:MAG: right-handed parallel beta-helix repeat-containing protein [Thermodesulfobacteriota bacterium]
MRLDKNIWIAFSRVLPALTLVLLLSSCSLYRVTRLNNYENFAEISNTVWARLYFAFNEVDIPGYDEIIYVDTRWRAKDSPVVIDSNLFVLPGVSLTIDPGVEVRLGKDVLVTCRGVIHARGTAEKPIRFTWLTEGECWNTIENLSSIGRKGASSEVVFEHCIIEHGHGLAVNSSEARIESCVFRHNIDSALQFQYAGGLIARNAFYQNSTERQAASGNGAGINVYSNRKVRIEDNDVYDNVSAGGRDGGGGIYAFAYSEGSVEVVNNRVRNNRSDRKAGGIFAYAARVSSNTVIDNEAAMTGGGIHAIESMLEKNVVAGNRAPSGGGIYSEASRINGNLVRANRAFMGTGLYHLGGGEVMGNTFVENGSLGNAADAAVTLSGSPVISRNNILARTGYALAFKSHSLSPDLQAGENYWGTTDKHAIEQLVCDWLEDSQVGLVNWDAYLPGPAPDACPIPEDADRTVSLPPPRGGAGTLRGLVETDTLLGDHAIRTYTVAGNLLVQEGCNLAVKAGTILVLNKDATIRVRGTMTAVGEAKQSIRFTGDRENPWGQLFFENRSTGPAQATGDTTFSPPDSLLRYCIVENGGGIVMDGKGADLLDCTVQNNRGTGVRIKEVSVSIKNCKVSGNVSDSDGGGIYVYGSRSVFIENNEIKNNRAADGGGIFAYGYQSNTAVDIRNNRIEGNVSEGDGGGVWMSRSALVNNLIIRNKTEAKGGGLYAGFGLVEDNRIAENSAADGGGIFAEANCSFKRNIINNNIATGGMGGGVYLNYWGLSLHNKEFLGNRVENNTAGGDNPAGGVVMNGEMDFRQNSITGNRGIQLHNLNSAEVKNISATLCYWGTTSQKAVAGYIYDGLDDERLSVVEYMPLAKTREAAITNAESKPE